MGYSKFHKAEEWSYIQIRTDEWEHALIKEMKEAKHCP